MNRTQERRQAQADFVDALAALDLGLKSQSGDAGVTLTVPGGGRLALEVSALSSPTPADVERLTRQSARSDHMPVLVADRLVPRVREALSSARWGWLDRRGHVRLVAGTLCVDSDVPSLSDDTARTRRPVLETSVGLAVATALLANAEERMSVRDLVTFTGHSLGAVHQARGSLRDEGLVDGTGLPLLPELFWEVSGHWRPRRVALASAPTPGDAARTSQLHLGLEDVASTEGWALCDTLAANGFGAPAVITGDYPPDFYVPDGRIVRVCRHLYRDAVDFFDRGATVAVPPVQWVCRHRVDPAHLRKGRLRREWPWVHPVVVALDLSTEAGRGREILDGWEPPAPYTRVW